MIGTESHLALSAKWCVFVSFFLCVNVPLFHCYFVSMSLCVIVSPCQCPSVSLSLCVIVSLCQCPFVSLFFCISVPLCQCPSVSVSLCVSVLLCYCLAVSMFPCHCVYVTKLFFFCSALSCLAALILRIECSIKIPLHLQRKEDLKKEDLEYKLFGNNLNRAMKWFKSFHKDRSHKFIFFPIVDPEKLRESYLAKHPQMKGELKLGAREDPYDNLKPNTNISVKAKRNVPKAAESTDKGVRKKTKKVKQEKKATKGTAKHYKKTILKTRLFEKLHDVKAWQRKLKENKKNTDDKNVNFSNRSKLRMLRNQGEEGMLDLREEDPSNILDIYIAKKTRNNFLRRMS